jgi:LysR family transcriptional regulator, glycine cleavage system transcriptional activator
VASPALLKAPLQSADDIISYPLLQLESRTGDWGRWLAHHCQPHQRPAAMLFDQFATMTQAAIHGLGAALIPRFLIEPDLASGRLVSAFGPAIQSLGSYYLVWPKDRPERSPLTSFRSWLAGQIAV